MTDFSLDSLIPTYEQFIADKGPEIEAVTTEASADIMNDSFEQALSGELDMNLMFSGENNTPLPVIDNTLYASVKEAKKAEDDGTASPEQVALLQQTRDPNGEVRQNFNTYYTFSDMPLEPIITGGNYPIDPRDGQMIPGPSLPSPIDIPVLSGMKEFITGARAFSPTYAAAETKAEDGRVLVEWMATRRDAPSSPVIRDVLTQALKTDMVDLVGEGIYNIASSIETGVRYHLPNFTRQSIDWATGLVNIDTDFARNEDELRQDLETFRNSAIFGDRQQFVNNIIRDQLRLRLGEEEFNRLGFNEKVTIDGVERFKKNFVSAEFADGLLEAVFDSKSLPEKVGKLVVEGYGVYNLVARPVTFINNSQRAIRRNIIRRKGEPVPFTLESTVTATAMAETMSAARGVPVQQIAKELALENTTAKWWHRWRANSIAQAIGDKAAYKTISSSLAENSAKIDDLKLQLKQAKMEKNSAKIATISNELSRQRALSNWGTIRRLAPGLRRYGIHPTFDVTMGLAMITGRNMAEGPIGEFYGAVTFMGLYGAKSFFQYKVPLVGNFADNMAFKTRANTEKLVSSAFALTGAAKRGFAEGWLINPNLKTVLFADDAAKSRMTSTELKAMRDMAEGFMGMPVAERQVIVDSLDQSFQDIDTVIGPISEYLEPNQVAKLRQTLSMSMAQASGASTFFAIARAMDLQTSGLTAKDIQTVNSKLKNKISQQVDGERQVAALGAIVESLDTQIMEISETISRTTDAPPEVVRARQEALDRLKILAGSFEGSYDFAVKELNDMIADDLQQSRQIVEELKNPVNVFDRDAALLSGQVDTLIEIQNRFDNRYRQNTANKGGFVEVASPNDPNNVSMLRLGDDGSSRVAAEAGLRQQTDVVKESIVKLQTAIITTVERSRLPSDSADIRLAASATISDLHKLTNLSGKQLVDDFYAKIPEVKNIELDVMGSNLLRFFEEFKTSADDSITRQLDPRTFDALGGRMGVNMIESLDGAAGRGLRLFFSNEDVLARVADNYRELDISVVTADDAIRVYKEMYYGADPQELAKMGVKNWEEITDLKLALRMMEDPELDVLNASTLRFIASPKELETLRQSMKKFTTSNNVEVSKFSKLVLGQIDNTFENWGQGLNEDAYNAVARARMAHRVDAQRNDQGTFGYKIDKATASTARIEEGAVVTGTSRDIAGLLNPLVDAVMNPTVDSPRIIKQEMESLLATFAPVTSSLPESVLTASPAAGKLRIMEAEELSQAVTSVMDGESYDRLRAIVTVALKNAFFEQSNIKGIKAFADKNKIPTLPPDNAPRAIQYPEADFDNVYDYLASIQDSFIVNVQLADGSVLKGQRLFDIEDILMQDRSITDVVNAIPEYRQAHADLLSLAKTELEGIEQGAEAVRTQEMNTLKQLLGGADSTVGDGFVANVLESTNAKAMDKFLDSTKRLVGTDEQITGTMQALFSETLKSVGGYGPGRRKIKLFDGTEVPTDSYGRPDQAFALLDDALSGGSQAGRNFKQLADAAGVTQEQLETLHAVFRLSTKISGERLVADAAAGTLKQTTKGFTLDNALSKAFNLARGMVSTEYVAAEVAIRYAALAKGRTLEFLVKDPRSAEIVRNLLNDPTNVDPPDALYFAQSLIKFVGRDIPRGLLEIDATDSDYIMEYWKSQGMVFDVDDRGEPTR